MMYALATGLPLIFIAFFGQMIKVIPSAGGRESPMNL